jgi:argininosuccinate lyase
VARAVKEAERRGCDLADLPLAALRRFSREIGKDVYRVLTLEGSIASRDHPGGTAPAQVRAAVRRARKRLKT